MTPQKLSPSELADLQITRDRLADQWWVRLLAHSKPEGVDLIIRTAVPLYLGNPRLIPSTPPWAGPGGVIDEKGIVRCNMVDKHNRRHFGWAWGDVVRFKDELLRTAEFHGFSQDEARVLFEAARAWVKADNRPSQEQAEDRVPR